MSTTVATPPQGTGGRKRPATPHATAAAVSDLATDPSLSAQMTALAGLGTKYIEDRKTLGQKWGRTMGTTAAVGNIKDQVKPLYSKGTPSAAPTVEHKYERDGAVQDQSIRWSEHLLRGPGSAFGGTIGETKLPLATLEHEARQGLDESQGGWVKDARGNGGTAADDTRMWNHMERQLDEYSQHFAPMYPKTGRYHDPTASIRWMNDKTATLFGKYGVNPETAKTGEFESNKDREQWFKALKIFRKEGGLTESEFKEMYPVISRNFALSQAAESNEGPEFMQEHARMTDANHSMMVPRARWEALAPFAKLQSRMLTKDELESREVEMSTCSGQGPKKKKYYGTLAVIPFNSLKDARKQRFMGLDWDEDTFDRSVNDSRVISHDVFESEYGLLSKYATVTDAEAAFDTDGPAGTGNLAKWCRESLDFHQKGTVVLASEAQRKARKEMIQSADLSMFGDKLKGCLYDKGSCQHPWCQVHGAYDHQRKRGTKGSTWTVDLVDETHKANETKYDPTTGAVIEQGFMAHAAPAGSTATGGVSVRKDMRMRGTKAERRKRFAAAQTAKASATASTAGTAMTAGATTVGETTAMTDWTDKTALTASEMPDAAPPTAVAASAAPAKSYLGELTGMFNRWRGGQSTAAPETTTAPLMTAMDAPSAWSSAMSTAAPIAAF